MFLQNLFIRAVTLAAQAVVFALVLIKKHVHVDVPHETGRAAEVQSALSSLSHVLNTSLSFKVPSYPSVNMGLKA